MERHGVAAVQFPARPEELLQSRLEINAGGNDAEMIPARAEAALHAEAAAQQQGDLLQEPVALGKAVLAVKKLHAGQIEIEENRLPALAQNGLPGVIGQLEEMRHGGKAGQMVVLNGLQNAALMQGIAQRAGQPLAADCILGIQPLIRIPDVGNARIPHVRDKAPAGMDKLIHAAPAVAGAVNHVEVPAGGDEALHGVCDARGIVRVYKTEDGAVHILVGFCAVFISEQLTKAVRKDERDDPPVQTLKDRKRLGKLFQGRAGLGRKLIAVHGDLTSCGVLGTFGGLSI